MQRRLYNNARSGAISRNRMQRFGQQQQSHHNHRGLNNINNNINNNLNNGNNNNNNGNSNQNKDLIDCFNNNSHGWVWRLLEMISIFSSYSIYYYLVNINEKKNHTIFSWFYFNLNIRRRFELYIYYCAFWLRLARHLLHFFMIFSWIFYVGKLKSSYLN